MMTQPSYLIAEKLNKIQEAASYRVTALDPCSLVLWLFWYSMAFQCLRLGPVSEFFNMSRTEFSLFSLLYQ